MSRGSILVSVWRLCMFVSSVHPVTVRSAQFCIACIFFVFISMVSPFKKSIKIRSLTTSLLKLHCKPTRQELDKIFEKINCDLIFKS